ncbi:hypothetical protein KNO15_03780 [Leifsonia shinshuensis]|uniref:hypothetical protein n=1 Tax=Leifsonia shinshuensis TaxID=150026 RepID=UPI001F50DAB9|nr:hypothetical protein [Leifsonia shinshuensis]MCI0155811.1 hypothetical protein [Leifsonia shinshuensis]
MFTGTHEPSERTTFNGSVENRAVFDPSVFWYTVSNSERDDGVDVDALYPAAPFTDTVGFGDCGAPCNAPPPSAVPCAVKGDPTGVPGTLWFGNGLRSAAFPGAAAAAAGITTGCTVNVTATTAAVAIATAARPQTRRRTPAPRNGFDTDPQALHRTPENVQ